MSEQNRRGVGFFGFGAAACAACCAGPLIAALSAAVAGGLIATFAVGAVGLILAALATTALLTVRRRRIQTSCGASIPIPDPTRRARP